jgi:hypothetical protein
MMHLLQRRRAVVARVVSKRCWLVVNRSGHAAFFYSPGERGRWPGTLTVELKQEGTDNMERVTYASMPLKKMRNHVKRVMQKLNFVIWSIRYEGLAFAMFRIGAKIPSTVGLQLSSSAWFQRLAEQRYDRRFGVNTSGMVPTAKLGISEEQRCHAVEYTPTMAVKFASLLSHLPLHYEKYAFVDFGCGKGRVLLIASDFPFHSIVGVELSPSLHCAAEENIARYRSRHQQCFDIDTVCADATAFEFPAEPLVLYFFNPFSDTIMRQVLDTLTRSLQARPRDVAIIYDNPVHEHLFADSEVFERFEFDGSKDPAWAIFRADVGGESEATDARISTNTISVANAI